MRYGIREDAWNSILLELQKHEKLRYGKLKDAIVDKQKICSERPFRETLSELVEGGTVKRIEIDRTNVFYTINTEILVLTDDRLKKMMEGFNSYKENFDEIKKILKSDANDVDKATKLKNHLKFLAIHEMQIMMLAQASGKSVLTKHVNDLYKLKKSLIALLIKRGSNEFNLLAALVYTRLLIETVTIYPEFVETFVNGFKDYMKSKRKSNSKDIRSSRFL